MNITKRTIIYFIIFLFGCSLISGCSKKPTKSNQPKLTPTVLNKNTKKEVLVQSIKQEFKVKLNKIQKDLETSEEKKECDRGSSFGMRVYVGKEYTEWDKALNEIYAVLKQQLSSDDLKKLEIEELNWIKEKEEKGWKAGANFKGGELERICCVDTEAYETKERCYELVEKYMK